MVLKLELNARQELIVLLMLLLQLHVQVVLIVIKMVGLNVKDVQQDFHVLMQLSLL